MSLFAAIMTALYARSQVKDDAEMEKPRLTYSGTNIGLNAGFEDYGFTPGFDSDQIWLHAEKDQWIRKYADDFYAEIKRKKYDEYRVCLYYQNVTAQPEDEVFIENIS